MVVKRVLCTHAVFSAVRSLTKFPIEISSNLLGHSFRLQFIYLFVT